MQKPTVLFLSLGKGSHIVLPQIFRNIHPSPKYIYLVHTSEVDSSYDIANAPPYLQEEIPKIKNALSMIMDMKSNELSGVEIEQVLVPKTDSITVRDILLPYLYKHPNCTYHFHLSAGTSELIMSLLVLAIWNSAKVWLTPKNEYNRKIILPPLYLSSLSERQRNLIRYLGEKRDAAFDSNSYFERVEMARECGYTTNRSVRFAGKVSEAFHNDMDPLLGLYQKDYVPHFGFNLVDTKIKRSERGYRLTETGLYAWHLLSQEEPCIPKKVSPEIPEEDCILFFSMGRNSYSAQVFHTTIQGHQVKPKKVYLIYEEKWDRITDGAEMQHAKGIRDSMTNICGLAGKPGFPESIEKLMVKNANLNIIKDTLSSVIKANQDNVSGVEGDKILKEKKKLKVSINATAGSSQMLISLFIAGVLVGADIHITPSDTDFILPIPLMNMNTDFSDVQKMILEYMGKEYEKGTFWVNRLAIADEIGFRENGDWVDSRMNRALTRTHMPPLLGEDKQKKLGYCLIRERVDKEDRREKQYCLTDEGIYAWKILSLSK